MSNLIDENKPTIIQLTKRGKRGGRDLSNQKAFFWNENYEKKSKEIVKNFLGEENVPRKQEKLVEGVEKKLLILYETALQREQVFLESLEKLSKKRNPITSQPSSPSDSSNADYARKFNRFVKEVLYQNRKDLHSLFLDVNYAALLAKQNNIFSLHSAADTAGVSLNEATLDLLNLFLSDNQGNDIQRLKGRAKKDFIQLQRIKITSLEKERAWWEKLKKYLIKYMGESGQIIFSNMMENNQFQQKVISLLSDEMTQLNIKGKRQVSFYISAKNQKGISEDLEKGLKGAFKEIMKLALKEKIKGINVGTPIGPLTLSSDTGTDENFYTININAKIWDEDDNLTSSENILQALLSALRESIEVYAKSLDYETGQLLDEFDQSKEIIREVIEKDIVKNDVKIRTNKELSKVIARWGYAQTRGILGELAAALSFRKLTKEENTVSVTGSNETGAGEVAMDVVVRLIGQQFGFQVKNFKSLKQRNFYQTDFGINQENIMKKYFGEDKDVYYWLFANRKMLDKTGLIRTASFKNKIEYSFYDYVDNFLRISSGDTPEDEFGGSDAFFIADKIIPSSFLYYKLIETIKNSRTKNGKRFELQQESNNYKYQEMHEGQKWVAIGIDSLISTFNARIEFKGINFNLENFN